MSKFEKVAVYAASIAIVFVFLAPILWVINISLKARRDIFVWPLSSSISRRRWRTTAQC